MDYSFLNLLQMALLLFEHCLEDGIFSIFFSCLFILEMYHLLVLSEFICLPKGSVCWSVFLGICATAVCSDISFFLCLNVLTCWGV